MDEPVVLSENTLERILDLPCDCIFEILRFIPDICEPLQLSFKQCLVKNTSKLDYSTRMAGCFFRFKTNRRIRYLIAPRLKIDFNLSAAISSPIKTEKRKRIIVTIPPRTLQSIQNFVRKCQRVTFKIEVKKSDVYIPYRDIDREKFKKTDLVYDFGEYILPRSSVKRFDLKLKTEFRLSPGSKYLRVKPDFFPSSLHTLNIDSFVQFDGSIPKLDFQRFKSLSFFNDDLLFSSPVTHRIKKLNIVDTIGDLDLKSIFTKFPSLNILKIGRQSSRYYQPINRVVKLGGVRSNFLSKISVCNERILCLNHLMSILVVCKNLKECEIEFPYYEARNMSVFDDNYFITLENVKTLKVFGCKRLFDSYDILNVPGFLGCFRKCVTRLILSSKRKGYSKEITQEMKSVEKCVNHYLPELDEEGSYSDAAIGPILAVLLSGFQNLEDVSLLYFRKVHPVIFERLGSRILKKLTLYIGNCKEVFPEILRFNTGLRTLRLIHHVKDITDFGTFQNIRRLRNLKELELGILLPGKDSTFSSRSDDDYSYAKFLLENLPSLEQVYFRYGGRVFYEFNDSFLHYFTLNKPTGVNNFFERLVTAFYVPEHARYIYEKRMAISNWGVEPRSRIRDWKRYYRTRNLSEEKFSKLSRTFKTGCLYRSTVAEIVFEFKDFLKSDARGLKGNKLLSNGLYVTNLYTERAGDEGNEYSVGCVEVELWSRDGGKIVLLKKEWFTSTRHTKIFWKKNVIFYSYDREIRTCRDEVVMKKIKNELFLDHDYEVDSRYLLRLCCVSCGLDRYLYQMFFRNLIEEECERSSRLVSKIDQTLNYIQRKRRIEEQVEENKNAAKGVRNFLTLRTLVGMNYVNVEISKFQDSSFDVMNEAIKIMELEEDHEFQKKLEKLKEMKFKENDIIKLVDLLGQCEKTLIHFLKEVPEIYVFCEDDISQCELKNLSRVNYFLIGIENYFELKSGENVIRKEENENQEEKEDGKMKKTDDINMTVSLLLKNYERSFCVSLFGELVNLCSGNFHFLLRKFFEEDESKRTRKDIKNET